MDLSKGRLPPHSTDAEASVLGALLLDSTAIDQIAEVIAPADFYQPANRLVFTAIADLSLRGEPIDLLTVTELLKARGELERVGGAAYVSELSDRAFTSGNVRYHARIIREKALLRALGSTASAIASQSYDGQEDVADFIDRAEDAVFRIAERTARESFVRAENLLKPAFARIEELYERKSLITGVPSGFLDLDRLTGGFQPSNLIIVAAQTSMGKTTLCMNVAEHAAIDHKVGAGFFSLEMSKEELVLRLLCSQARIDLGKLRTGTLRDKDFPALAEAAGRIADAPIYIDDTPGLTPLELRSRARRLAREKSASLGLIVVDYLQLMRGSGRADNREQEIAEISRALKGLAKELRIPVIALSQLNRQVTKRASPEPQVSDLRESGAIEQDADLILFIYSEKERDPDDRGPIEVKVKVAKHRNGALGRVPLMFLQQFVRFENLDWTTVGSEGA